MKNAHFYTNIQILYIYTVIMRKISLFNNILLKFINFFTFF